MTVVEDNPKFTAELNRVIDEWDAEFADSLSPEQRRWWLLGDMAGEAPCVVAARYRVAGDLDLVDVELRLTDLVAQQQALRSVFIEVAGRPVALVLPVADLSLRTVDLRDEPDQRDQLTDVLVRTVAEPFDVGQGPLVRVVLVRLANDSWELSLVAHRLIADRTSLDLIANGLVGQPVVPGEELHHVLAAQRQHHRLGADIHSIKALGSRLTAPSAREVPSSGERPDVKGHERSIETVELRARSVATGQNARTEQVVSAWLAVLMRYQASDSAQCGVHLPRPEHPALVGPLDNVHPVRVDTKPSDSLAAVSAATRDELDRATRQNVSFARLLEVHPPERDLSRTPYVQTSVRVVDSAKSTDPGHVRLEPVPSGIATGEHDLDVAVWFHDESITVEIDYDTSLYTADEVRDIVGRFSGALGQFGEHPDASALTVAELPMLDEPSGALGAGRGDRHPLPDLSLVDLIGSQVRTVTETGRDRPAVCFRDSALGYQELWRRAGVLAETLRKRGVRQGDRVAVWLRRGPDAVASQLAVLRCGAVLVPVDPQHPVGRVRFLLSDSGAMLAISESSVDVLGDLPVPTLRLDEWDPSEREVPAVHVRADDPAYVIYTSGSTGQPKGVVVRHRSVVNNLRWRQRRWNLTSEDRVLHNHAFSFDPSMWALLWPLTTGATIVLAAESEMDDPAALVRLLRDQRVTALGGVPSLLGLLLEHPEAGQATKVRLLLSGAETLDRSLVDRARELWSAEVANLYGPTEGTIDATAHVTGPRGPARVPIGRPIDNGDVHVVDQAMRPLPPLMPGEIVIGGAGVAIGYQNRPALTAERFLPDPFGAPGARLYRTGDLGRRLPGGEVQFLGRVDDQIKIRGYRVEPREVESVLARCPGVASSAVVALDAGTEDARLAAAVVLGESANEGSIRDYLVETLPSYLVPDRIVAFDSLPRTATGKIDYRGLAERLNELPCKQRDHTAPRTELESAVASAFEQVLGSDDIDVHADFFEVGGTSIMLARLSTLLQARHNVDIPLHEFFRLPTVAGVADTIETYRRSGLAAVLGRQHAATLEGDAYLDDGISPDGLPQANWFEPERVLLTGATGYLGLHLLEELLRRTSAEVICLCRGDDREHALRRIRDGLAEYEIDVDDQLGRVRCLVGDLGEPLLGLDRGEWDELASTIDAIYHNGALVNFVYPYSVLKAPNVGGTQQVLELACTERLKAVHYVSTIDTLLATHTPRPFLEDDTPLRSAVNVPAGYTGSKWVAEKVVDIARQRGIPVTIFRPGLILGHTRTGATQPTDYLLVAFRGFLPMGILPDYPRIFDTVPVDYVASAIAHISTRPSAVGGFYHLFNPDPVPLRRFCSWLEEYGYRFDIVPFEEGRRRALEVGPGHPLYPIVPLIRDAEAEPHRALDPEYMAEVAPDRECAETLRHLEGSGIHCPSASSADAHGLLSYLVRTGFLPAPHDIVPESPSSERP